MKNRVAGIVMMVPLALFALAFSGCNKPSPSSVKAAGKAQLQPTAKDVSPARPQPAGSEVSRAQTKPSDEEIARAIDYSGIMKRADGSFTVVAPLKIVEKGHQNQNGSWPVKVTFTITCRLKDGQVSPPLETTSLFKIFEAKNDQGKYYWQAQLGS